VRSPSARRAALDPGLAGIAALIGHRRAGDVSAAHEIRYRSVLMATRALTPEIRARLRYVKVRGDGVDLAGFPDFFIAGPQRTGTTWLHANMRFHPEIFLSEPKEIYYFSRLKTPTHPKFQSADLGWYLRFFRERPALWVYKQVMCLYRSGRPYLPKIRGEATASYAALDPDVIEEVALLNPCLKIVVMVRDPIERVWSHAKKDLARNRGRRLEDVADDELHAFFRDPYQIQCARYAENIERWRRFFPNEQIHVGRFDDIERRPEAFLREVLRFLGVSDDPRFVPASVAEAVNPTAESKVPERHRRFLEELLSDEIASWRQRFA
jgi:hypothetical protein